MRALLTGGSGVIGEGSIPALVGAGWAVRLLSRHADDEARRWPRGVEAFPGDVTRPESLAGCASGCEAVVHVAGAARAPSPEVSLEELNVEGTRHLLAEAEAAGAPRLVFVSSLGAERGASDYHRSKLAAEELVERYPGRWTILRPGAVFGPGDETVSLLLRMARRLPAVPVVGLGEQRFQPLWTEDFGRAVAAALGRDDLDGRVLLLAGPEVTTTRDLLARLAALLGREPMTVPVPAAAALPLTRLAETLGLPFPLDEARLRMLVEENFVPPGEVNALTAVLGVDPLPLDEALRRLVEAPPEQLAAADLPLRAHRFRAEIEGAAIGPAELLRQVGERFGELMPLDFACDGRPCRRLELGRTLTATLPGVGQFAVRVEELGAERITLAAAEGHFLAGVVAFRASRAGGRLRFGVEVLAQAAGLLDALAMAALGDRRQRRTWRSFVEAVVALSGGTAPAGVEESDERLDDEAAAAVRRWMEELVVARERRERAGVT
ncbi:MAG TPA: NAD-dependent epimerase/dehydratase family protein [Thermoanaerobaculia bacterium]|nr:NAD-dependent epimerase/dehydratase family protein [Thermoanaerobaculia bacterium]